MTEMNLLAWNQRRSAEIPGVEEQHRELVTFLNRLTESREQGKTRDAQNLALLRFIEYAIFHFKKEAELIGKYGYGEHLLQYENDHYLLIRALDEVRQRVRRPEFAVDGKVLFFLKNVYQNHVHSGERCFLRRRETT